MIWIPTTLTFFSPIARRLSQHPCCPRTWRTCMSALQADSTSLINLEGLGVPSTRVVPPEELHTTTLWLPGLEGATTSLSIMTGPQTLRLTTDNVQLSCFGSHCEQPRRCTIRSVHPAPISGTYQSIFVTIDLKGSGNLSPGSTLIGLGARTMTNILKRCAATCAFRS